MAVLAGPDFDPLSITLMTTHHKGAILMADKALHRAGDIHLRLMSHATRHAQRVEIEDAWERKAQRP